MKKILLCAALVGLWVTPALSQTTEELNNDGKNTENVLTQSMGCDRKTYSPLNQINRSNIRRLVPIWNASLMNELGELAAPTMDDNFSKIYRRFGRELPALADDRL